MVQPGAIAAMNATKNKNIGIIGTNATIKSGQYGQYLRKLDPSVTVVTKACPLFVPLVEEGLIDDRITEDMVSRYLREFKQYDLLMPPYLSVRASALKSSQLHRQGLQV